MDDKEINYKKLEKKLLPENQYMVVTKSEFVQRSVSSLSETASTVLDMLISMVKENDNPGTVINFNIADYIRLCGVSRGGNYAVVRKALNEIDRARQWVRYKKDNGDECESRLRIFNTLHGIKTADGTESNSRFEITFHEEIFPVIYNLKNEKYKTMYELGYSISLKGVYAKTLYRLLKSYENNKKWKFSLGDGSNSDLHLKLGKVEIDNNGEGHIIIPKSWGEWRDFSRQVLKPAVEQINEKTDLLVSFEGLREKLNGQSSSRIEVVEFTIEKKSEKSIEELRKRNLIDKGFIDNNGLNEGLLSSYSEDEKFIEVLKNRFSLMSEADKGHAFNSVFECVLEMDIGVSFVDVFSLIDLIYYNDRFFRDACMIYKTEQPLKNINDIVNRLANITMRLEYEDYLSSDSFNYRGMCENSGVVEGRDSYGGIWGNVGDIELISEDEIDNIDDSKEHIAEELIVNESDSIAEVAATVEDYKKFDYVASLHYRDEIFGVQDLYEWEKNGRENIPEKLKYFEMSIRHSFWNAFGEELADKNICSLIHKCFMILNRESGQAAAVNYIYHYIDKIKNSDSETHSSYFARLYDSVVADYDGVKLKYME